MADISAKDPGEKIFVRFDFGPDLEPGESLAGPITVSATRIGNTHGNSPVYFIGNYYVENAVVRYMVAGGQLGSKYRLRCEADTDSSPPRHLIVNIDLPIAIRMGTPT